MSTMIDRRPAAQPHMPIPVLRPATFADALRSERIKLTSVRSTRLTLLVTVALGIGVGALSAYLTATHYGSTRVIRATWDPTAASLFAFVVAAFTVAVLGVLTVTSEYGTGMIRASLAAVPRRSRFLAAKAVAFTAVVLVVGEVTAFAAFLLGQALIGSRAPHADLGDPGVLRAVIGAGLYLTVIGLLAMAVGTLVRRTAAGISIVVGLLYVLPNVALALPGSWGNRVTEFWPTQAGTQLFYVHRGAYTLTAWSGFGVLVAFTAVVGAIAVYALHRRDA
jgi:ABC-2 type transport system permease protein